MTSKYQRLTDLLADRYPLDVEIAFDDLDVTLGGLPASAKKYAAWWANSQASHDHASSWLNAGYKAHPRFGRGVVQFEPISGSKLGHSVVTSQIALSAETSSVLAFGPREVSQNHATSAQLPKDSSQLHRRIGLVGCVKSKLTSAHQAAELYISPLFRFRRHYVERSCDEWWILSALHGLVRPDQELAPYDVTLKNSSIPARRIWSDEVLKQIVENVKPTQGDVFEFHAGNDYRAWGLESGLRSMGFLIDNPTEGMAQGLQLSFYKANQ